MPPANAYFYPKPDLFMPYFLLAIVLLLTACGTSSTKTDKPEAGTLDPTFTLPYQLNAPAETYKLPKELNEVSGLSYYKDDKLLCVEDEDECAHARACCAGNAVRSACDAQSVCV